jgi:hypothetical protein
MATKKKSLIRRLNKFVSSGKMFSIDSRILFSSETKINSEKRISVVQNYTPDSLLPPEQIVTCRRT